LNLSHIFYAILLLTVGCTGSKSFDGTSTSTSSYSGNFIITTVATDPATGPGVASMWSPSGSFISNLRDFYSTGEWASGSGFVPPNQILLLVGAGTRIEKLNLSTLSNTNFYVGTRLNGSPNRFMVRDPADGSVYVSEQTANDVEKFDSNGNPVGAPFIGTTVTTGSNTCTTATPYGMTVITTNSNLAVINAARLNIYASDGTCVTTQTGAPFSTNTPTAIAYQATTDSLIVAFSVSHAIYACSSLGASCTQIYLNSAIINTPKALAVDSSGYIYVGSNGTDTVEKLVWTGTGTASRALSGPFMGPSVFTQNPTGITVVP